MRRVLLLLSAVALIFAFSSCSKKDVEDVVAIDLGKLTGTWEGTYTPALSSVNLTEPGTVEISKEGKDELIVHTLKIKNIKLKIETNNSAVVNCKAVETDVIESGTLLYTDLKGSFVLTVNVKKGSEEKSFVFTSTKKR